MLGPAAKNKLSGILKRFVVLEHQIKVTQVGTMSTSEGPQLDHHKRFEYCQNRLKYRDGNKQTAVKVYTIANESKHLLVFGVPRINLLNEVKREFGKIGIVTSTRLVTGEIVRNGSIELEQFTDCYHVVYEKLHIARRAKKFLDAKNFYGGILHISYAPEYESIDDVKSKFQQRKSEVNYRIRINAKRLAQEEQTMLKRKNSKDVNADDSSAEGSVPIHPKVTAKRPKFTFD